MSAWRLAVRELHQHGGAATLSQLSGDITRHAMDEAIRHGLVQGPGRGTHGRKPYCLTPAGIRLAENRLALVRRPERASALVPRPTWLDSLPDDIRLNRGGCSANPIPQR